jgi:hypothetical protein
MGLYEGKPTVWMRALRATQYDYRPIREGDPYLVHEYMVETIESLGLGRREPAPLKLTREQAAKP